ncbi:hypothetical protein GWI33_002926 [Rhynchophorus ferrugineus]|uniref:Uncharacterized protein n=1 Tax=Rhynchophorus ferrugineus TaxID=354439 RepID=A0A834LY31_RHYFE|nr:hypothetical protein GWI33_002926 [Rhynchophorus ferrugineus]
MSDFESWRESMNWEATDTIGLRDAFEALRILLYADLLIPPFRDANDVKLVLQDMYSVLRSRNQTRNLNYLSTKLFTCRELLDKIDELLESFNNDATMNLEVKVTDTDAYTFMKIYFESEQVIEKVIHKSLSNAQAHRNFLNFIVEMLSTVIMFLNDYKRIFPGVVGPQNAEQTALEDAQ